MNKIEMTKININIINSIITFFINDDNQIIIIKSSNRIIIINHTK